MLEGARCGDGTIHVGCTRSACSGMPELTGPDLIEVAVAYARAERQVEIPVMLHEGATVAEAIRKSRIRDLFPELRAGHGVAGIYGKVTAMEAPVHAGDRIEIYRPLEADPKTIRRARAARRKLAKR